MLEIRFAQLNTPRLYVYGLTYTVKIDINSLPAYQPTIRQKRDQIKIVTDIYENRVPGCTQSKAAVILSETHDIDYHQCL